MFEFTSHPPPPDVWSAAGIAAELLNVANAALPYIAGGVTAAVVIFAVMLGIRKGLASLRTVGK